jgi:hypothetical protein
MRNCGALRSIYLMTCLDWSEPNLWIRTQSSLEQFANLFDGVIHLHIELALAKLSRRAARISNNAIVDPLGVPIGCFTSKSTRSASRQLRNRNERTEAKQASTRCEKTRHRRPDSVRHRGTPFRSEQLEVLRGSIVRPRHCGLWCRSCDCSTVQCT